MKKTFDESLERYRVYGVDAHNAHYNRKGMQVRTSDRGGWDHVSVSFNYHLRRWSDQKHVGDTFAAKEE